MGLMEAESTEDAKSTWAKAVRKPCLRSQTAPLRAAHRASAWPWLCPAEVMPANSVSKCSLKPP